EVETLLKQMGMNDPVVQIDFELKENVRVTDGPFTDFTGTIEDIDTDKQKIKVHVNMFGRETPVELDYTQIEKLKEVVCDFFVNIFVYDTQSTATEIHYAFRG